MLNSNWTSPPCTPDSNTANPSMDNFPPFYPTISKQTMQPDSTSTPVGPCNSKEPAIWGPGASPLKSTHYVCNVNPSLPEGSTISNVGALGGGPQCRMLNIINGNIPCHYFCIYRPQRTPLYRVIQLAFFHTTRTLYHLIPYYILIINLQSSCCISDRERRIRSSKCLHYKTGWGS